MATRYITPASAAARKYPVVLKTWMYQLWRGEQSRRHDDERKGGVVGLMVATLQRERVTDGAGGHDQQERYGRTGLVARAPEDEGSEHRQPRDADHIELREGRKLSLAHGYDPQLTAAQLMSPQLTLPQETLSQDTLPRTRSSPQ